MIKLFMYHMIEFINVRENRNDNQQWTETRATLDTRHISTTYIAIWLIYILTKYNTYTGIMSRERLGFKLLRAYMLNVF